MSSGAHDRSWGLIIEAMWPGVSVCLTGLFCSHALDACSKKHRVHLMRSGWCFTSSNSIT